MRPDKTRTRPFEIDPAGIELVVEEPVGSLPVPVAPEPPPPRRRAWPWLVGGGLAALFLALGYETTVYLSDLVARLPVLGWTVAALAGAAFAGAATIAVREVVALRRLRRASSTRAEGERLWTSEIHGEAQPVLDGISRGLATHPGASKALEAYRAAETPELTDGERIRLFAGHVLVPLDREAYRRVVDGARDIGVLTALSPLGLLDTVFVLARSLAMLRAVARTYGVAPGALGTAFLLRRTVRNVAIAGVAELVSDAAVETVGASLAALLSARAGQGATNALLAARLGIAAMDQCRPLPFAESERPSLRRIRRELLGASDVEGR